MNFERELSRHYSNQRRHRFYIKQSEAFHLSKPFIKTENELSLYKIYINLFWEKSNYIPKPRIQDAVIIRILDAHAKIFFTFDQSIYDKHYVEGRQLSDKDGEKKK